MADVEQLKAALIKAHEAGDTEAAEYFASQIRPMQGGTPTAASMTNWKRVGENLSTPTKAIVSGLGGFLPGFADEAIGGTVALASRVGKVTGPVKDAAEKIPLIGDYVAPYIPGREIAALPIGDVYRGARDIARGAQQSYQKENPILSTATEIGIGMAPGSALNAFGGWLASRLPGGAITRAIGTGGAFGALSGAGSAPEMGDIPASAAVGGVTGAATGGAISAGMQGTGALVNAIRPRFSEPSAKAIAERRVAQAFVQDKVNEQEARQLLQKLGPESRLADVGGANVRSLLDLQATLPGSTKDAVEKAIRERQAGRSSRIVGSAESLMSTTGQRLNTTLDALDQFRAQTSKPLYDIVKNTTVPVDDDLAMLLKRAAPALADARQLAQVQGRPFSIGNPNAKEIPLSELDTLKRSLYDRAYSNLNEETGRLNETGNAFNSLRKELVNKLDDLTKDADGKSIYKAARDAYAGPTELRNAAMMGSQAMSKDAWKIKDITDGMSDSEMHAFRVGVMEALRKKAGTEGGQTSLLKFWKEPATASKLQEVFPSKRLYQEFAETLTSEGRLKAFEQIGRGSQTAARQAGLDEQNGELLRELGALAMRPTAGNAGSMMQSAVGAYRRAATPEPVRDQIGGLLLSRGDEAQGLLGGVGWMMQREAERRAQAAGSSGLSGGLLTNQLLQMLNR